MEPVVISSAAEEEFEVLDRSFNHQEIDAVRKLTTDGDNLRNDPEQDIDRNMKEYPLGQAISSLRLKYNAGEIDSQKVIEILDNVYEINRFDYFTVSLSLCLLMADIVSDISVGIRYLVDEDWVYAVVTLAVVFAASLMQQAIYWNISLWKEHRGKKRFWLWIGPYMACNMESGHLYVRNLKHIGQIIMYKEQKNIYELTRCWELFTYQYCTVAIRKHWEALLEAGPQMVLQLYILLKTSASLSLDLTTVLQLLALVTSLLGLTATKVTMYKARCIRRARRIRFWPAVLYAIGLSFPIGCRAVSIAALMSVRPMWGGLMVLCHWLAATGWWRYTYKKGIIAAAAAGLVLILDTLETASQTTLVCCVLWWTEDVAMLVLWWTLTDFPAALPLLCGTLVVDIVFRIVFYILIINNDKLYKQIEV